MKKVTYLRVVEYLDRFGTSTKFSLVDANTNLKEDYNYYTNDLGAVSVRYFKLDEINVVHKLKDDKKF